MFWIIWSLPCSLKICHLSKMTHFTCHLSNMTHCWQTGLSNLQYDQIAISYCGFAMLPDSTFLYNYILGGPLLIKLLKLRPFVWLIGYCSLQLFQHYSDVIMGTMASQISSLTIVYSTVYSGADQRKHQSSASLAFVRGIHQWPVNSPYKGPVARKMFPSDNVIMGFGLVYGLSKVTLNTLHHSQVSVLWRHQAYTL